MKTLTIDYLNYLLNPTEASIYKVYQSGHSYQHIMDSLQLSVINIDNGIQRINRKKRIIQHTLETIEELQKMLVHSSVNLNPPLDWEKAEQMARQRSVELPFDYLVLITQLGNGGTIAGEHFFSLEESLQKAQDEWMPFYQNKWDTVYCLGIQEWNENIVEPAIYDIDSDRPNDKRLIDCIHQLIRTCLDSLNQDREHKDKIEELKQRLIHTFVEMREVDLRTELYYILNHISAEELEKIYPSHHPINSDKPKNGV